MRIVTGILPSQSADKQENQSGLIPSDGIGCDVCTCSIVGGTAY